MAPASDDSLSTGIVTMDPRLSKTMDAEELASTLNECFLQFGNDPIANINLLTAMCGRMLGATCALYNRLCDGKFVVWGQWNTPADFIPNAQPEGHICHEVIQKKDNNMMLVRNLQESRYARTDHNIRQYDLQTYMGMGVSFAEQRIGSLCVVFQNDFIPSSADEKLMRFASLAIGVEEKRLQAENALKLAHQSMLDILDNMNAVVHVADMTTHEVVGMNKHARDVFGDGVGKSCWQIFQQDQDGPCSFCSNHKLLDEWGNPAGEYTWEMWNTRNGRWYEMRDSAVRLPDNRLVRIQIATEISKRKAVTPDMPLATGKRRKSPGKTHPQVR